MIAILEVFGNDLRLLRRADLDLSQFTVKGRVAEKVRGACFALGRCRGRCFLSARLNAARLGMEPIDISRACPAARFPALGVGTVDGEEVGVAAAVGVALTLSLSTFNTLVSRFASHQSQQHCHIGCAIKGGGCSI